MNSTDTKHFVQNISRPIRTPQKKALSVKGLTKSYGPTNVLQGVDLDVFAGERVALMGRSGSGKSTLLNCVCGIEPFDSGEVMVADKRLSGMPVSELERLRREDIGYVFQSFHLLPTLTALENVEFPAQLIRMPAAERRARASSLLAKMGMEQRKNNRPATLSGGERQRVALARSMMNRPRLILADEPTGSLDSSSGECVLDLIEELSIESSVSVLLVTHDPGITRICDRVLHMQDGRIGEAQR